MKALLGATALTLAMIAAPVAAHEVNIHIHGEGEAKVERGAHGKDHGEHMGGRHMGGHHMEGRHHRMGRGERKHDRRGGGRDEHHKGHGGGHHGMSGEGRIDRTLGLIELYDRDGDGKVTQAEIDQIRADRLAEFDRDGDGRLSLQEYEALWLDAMRERMVDRFQSHDDDGDGQVTVEEFADRTSHMVPRLDRNDDGAISLEDTRRGKHGGGMRGGEDSN